MSEDAGDDVALMPTLSTTDPQVAIGDLPSELAVRRYVPVRPLGSGGMGVVEQVHDEWIGRDVARKSLRAQTAAEPRLVSSFLREARIQGQLEHPSIVPIHDLGLLEDGTPFFMMKRVRGRTLAERIHGPDALPRRRLLEIFRQVCLGVDYAHARGVVHRDLKPDNIMLGDFGEVYVLDWGVARLAAEPTGSATLELDARAGETDLSGTPGYMAPEQVRAEPVDRRADVFALGAILFEVLTGQRLIEERSVGAALSASLLPTRAPSAVDAHVPPELDALCALATELDPARRLPSARALAAGVERYLDGERDDALRRARAGAHAERARDLLTSAGDTDRSAEAGRELLRALSLDPDQHDAQRLLVELLSSPPANVPEIESALEAERRKLTRLTAFVGVPMYGGLATLALLWVYFGGLDVHEVALFATATVSAISASILVGCVAFLPPMDARVSGIAFAAFLSSTVAITALSRVASPIVLVPVLMVANATTYLLTSPPRQRIVIVTVSSLALVIAVVFELLAPLATLSVGHEQLVIRPRMVGGEQVGLTFHAAPYVAVVTSAVVLVVLELIMRAVDRARRAIEVQRWQLRRLLPDVDAARPDEDPQGKA